MLEFSFKSLVDVNGMIEYTAEVIVMLINFYFSCDELMEFCELL
jgi:hypothetical protein